MPAQRKRKENAEIDRNERLPTALRIVSLGAIFVAPSVFLFNLWNIRFIPSLSTDSLIYHLTIPASWKQHGFLHAVDLPFHDGAAEHSPLLTESLIYLLMRITGDDGLAWLVQAAFFLLMAWGFYRSARQLEIDASTSRFLTTFVLLFPPFFRSAQIINSEMVLTCGTAIFCFGMLLTRTNRQRGCVVAATGIALMLAAKTIGIIYGSLAILILAGWITIALRAAAENDAQNDPKTDVNSDGKPHQPVRWWITIIGAMIVLAGSFFYWRNFIVFGNPLYPAELFGLPGRYDTSVFVKHGWSTTVLFSMLFDDKETFAMKSQFAVVLWIGMLVTLGNLVLRRLHKVDILPTVLFVGYPLASIIFYFAVTPFWSEHRLLFPVYYLLWGGLAWSLFLLSRNLSQPHKDFYALAIGVICGAYTLVFVFFDEVPFWLVGIAAASGLVLGNYPEFLKKRGRYLCWLPVSVVALAMLSGPWWYADYAQQRRIVRAQYYPRVYAEKGEAWNQIEQLTANRPATIAYSGNSMIFPLFGAKISNRVVYLPLHEEDLPKSIELNGTQSLYLQLARQRRAKFDKAYWLQQLRENEVEFLYLVDDPAFGSVEAELSTVKQNPSLFQPVYQQANVFVYQVAPSIEARAAEAQTIER